MKPTRREFVAGSVAGLALPLLRVVRPRGGGWRAAAACGALRLHAAAGARTPPRARAARARTAQRRAPSGFAERDGKPVLAIGPVPKDAAYWHGTEKVKDVPRAWPFVACSSTRARASRSRTSTGSAAPPTRRAADGWLADPGVDYAGHHNAQLVTDQDDRWCYLAVPDAPTGDYVGGAQFALRARVVWADGRRVQKGWWLRFDAPAAARERVVGSGDAAGRLARHAVEAEPGRGRRRAGRRPGPRTRGARDRAGVPLPAGACGSDAGPRRG